MTDMEFLILNFGLLPLLISVLKLLQFLLVKDSQQGSPVVLGVIVVTFFLSTCESTKVGVAIAHSINGVGAGFLGG